MTNIKSAPPKGGEGIDGNWCFDMDKAPKHKEVLVYRKDAGVFMALHSSIEGNQYDLKISDKEYEKFSEEELFAEHWWCLQFGSILEGSDLPTAWMIPKEPTILSAESGTKEIPPLYDGPMFSKGVPV